MGYWPDGVLVLPDGQRVAVEVELHDKGERPGRKLAWYGRASGYTGVLWVMHRPAIRAALEAAFRRERPAGGVAMRAELLPPEVAVWSD